MRFRKSLRMKFLGCLLAVSVLPVVILFLFTLNNNSRFYQNQISELGNHEVQSKVARVDRTFEHLQELLTALIFSTYDNESCMLDICSQESQGVEPTKYERLMNARKFEYVSNNLIGTDQYVEGVYLFNESGYTYSFVKNKELGLEEDYENAEWYQAIRESSDFEGVQMYKSEVFQNQTVLMGRVFSGQSGHSILVIICNENVFGQVAEDGQTFLVDGEGCVIYGNEEETLSAKAEEEIISGESGVLSLDKGENYAYGTTKINGWKIVSEISFEALKELYGKNTIYLVCLILIIISFVAILVIYADRAFLRPLTALSGIMCRSANEKFELPDKSRKRTDEIGTLYRGYEKMMGEINILIQEKYVGEIKYLNSCLQNLMSQINAHFIFNTLENISALAYMENNAQIATMSKSLGDMLRYSIEYERDEETLRTEINHIKQYIQIQQIRFGNQIQLKEEIEDGTDKARVPKFMLQPIIENAIEHGLAEIDVTWRICIRVSRKEQNLMVSVLDNGVGMSEKAAQIVRRRIVSGGEESSDSRYVSIGLSNIHKRIQLLYPGAYGLDINCPEDGGLEIMVCIPYHI